jgi:HAMP domain-containing protein
MKTISIKGKVIIVLTLSLTASAALQIGLVRESYNKNVAMVASAALTAAQKTFDNIKAKELSSLGLASSALGNMDTVRDLFLKGDRQALYAYLAPTYLDLKSRGLGVITFLDKEGTAFLRMKTPAVFGDSLRAVTTVRKAMESNEVAAGIDLVKPGLSRGSCRPLRDGKGVVVGYVIVGGSLDDFLSTMKSQTGDDYTLMGYKSFLDEKLYHDARTAKGLADTWAQFGGVAVLATSMDVQSNGQYEAALQDLSASGRLLERSETGGNAFVNGVFPLYDAAGNSVGGIFVRHDITALHSGMKRVQTLSVVALVVLTVLLCLIIASVLNKLVFVRLRRTMDIVTRVVGGEFSQKIVSSSPDEVGQLENLFEQFRTIFVGVVDEVSKQRAEEEKKSA